MTNSDEPFHNKKCCFSICFFRFQTVREKVPNETKKEPYQSKSKKLAIANFEQLELIQWSELTV